MTHHYTTTLNYTTDIDPRNPFPDHIETDRLEFKPLTPDTVPPAELRDALSENQGTDQSFPIRNPLGDTYGHVFDLYDQAESARVNRTDMFYALFTTTDTRFIGFAAIENIEFKRRKAELGVWLRQDAWGNGYSQERAEALLEVLFNHLDFDVVEVSVIPENTPSVIAVKTYMREFGGSFDGRTRNAVVTAEDVSDVYTWSITADEYNSDTSWSAVQPPTPSGWFQSVFSEDELPPLPDDASDWSADQFQNLTSKTMWVGEEAD